MFPPRHSSNMIRSDADEAAPPEMLSGGKDAIFSKHTTAPRMKRQQVCTTVTVPFYIVCAGNHILRVKWFKNSIMISESLILDNSSGKQALIVFVTHVHYTSNNTLNSTYRRACRYVVLLLEPLKTIICCRWIKNKAVRSSTESACLQSRHVAAPDTFCSVY